MSSQQGTVGSKEFSVRYNRGSPEHQQPQQPFEPHSETRHWRSGKRSVALTFRNLAFESFSLSHAGWPNTIAPSLEMGVESQESQASSAARQSDVSPFKKESRFVVSPVRTKSTVRGGQSLEENGDRWGSIGYFGTIVDIPNKTQNNSHLPRHPIEQSCGILSSTDDLPPEARGNVESCEAWGHFVDIQHKPPCQRRGRFLLTPYYPAKTQKTPRAPSVSDASSQQA